MGKKTQLHASTASDRAMLSRWGSCREFALLLAVVALTACSGVSDFLSVRSGTALAKNDSHGRIFFNQADYRAVYSTLRSKNGVQNVVVCAEPSPDIAKVYGSSGAFGASASKGGVGGSLFASIARAQAAAQLGERLATIQLVRDILYRACEAYANRALSETSYAVIISRMDDLMVTLMLGEFVAGNYGRKPVTLTLDSQVGGGADTKALAAAVKDEAAAKNKAETAQNAAKQAQQKLAKMCIAAGNTPQAPKQDPKCTQALASAETSDVSPPDSEPANNPDSADSEKPSDEEIKKAKDEVDKKNHAAEDALDAWQVAKLKLNTTASAYSDTIHPQIDEKRAEMLARMQRKYIENVNIDALVVACIHALGDGQDSKLDAACGEQFAADGSVGKFIAANINYVHAKKRLAEEQRDIKRSFTTVAELDLGLARLRNELNTSLGRSAATGQRTGTPAPARGQGEKVEAKLVAEKP